MSVDQISSPFGILDTRLNTLGRFLGSFVDIFSRRNFRLLVFQNSIR